MQNTLVIIKPDAVERGLVGEITSRIENKGLFIKSLKLCALSADSIEEHYAHHDGKPFFRGLVDFMTSGPVVVMVIEGIDSIDVMRRLCGTTNGRLADPGTIRGDFSQSQQINLIHASDSEVAAQAEIKRFAKHIEIVPARSGPILTTYASDEV